MTFDMAQPASLLKRTIAGCLDYVLMVGLLWAPILLVVFGNIDSEIEFTRGGMGRYFMHIRLIVLWLVPFCLRDVIGGRSFGKWITGCRTVDAADAMKPATFKQQIVRNLTIWLSPVGIISAASHPDKMRFGDRLANTMVVDVIHDPVSSTWTRRLFKGMVLVAVLLGGLTLYQAVLTGYLRNSRVHAVSAAYIDGYEPLQIVTGEADASAFDVLRAGYGPTDNGALAALIYLRKAEEAGRVVEFRLQLERTLDDFDSWRVTRSGVQFRSGRDVSDIEGLARNDVALAFIKSYPPLNERVPSLPVDALKLLALEDDLTGTEPCVQTIYAYETDDVKLRLTVVMARDAADACSWLVKDASGAVQVIKGDADDSEQVWAFIKSRNIHRILTAQELKSLAEMRLPLHEAIKALTANEEGNPAAPPETGAPDADNATAEPGPRPVESAPKPVPASP